MNDVMLSIDKLYKKFGDFIAVNNISLSVNKGEIFGFLGPNGAGKTTTIKMITGLLLPDKGSVTISNYDLMKQSRECKRLTGYIPDRPYVYEKLTGAEYLRFINSLYDKKNSVHLQNLTEKYLSLFGLTQWQDHLVEGYSHGMRQKLIMASIFILDQPFLVIDEPMVGLDPKSARIVKDLLKTKASKGTTVFLSTHSMEIAEELCDRICIIDHGSIRAVGDINEIRHQTADGSRQLEDIFLQLTGAYELQEVIKVLRE